MARTWLAGRKIVGERAKAVPIGCNAQGTDSVDDPPDPPNDNPPNGNLADAVDDEEDVNRDPVSPKLF
jgi:hypothetical protein